MKKFYYKLFKGSLVLSLFSMSPLTNAQVYVIGNGQMAKAVSDKGKVVVLNSNIVSYYWTPEEGLQTLDEMPSNVYYIGNPTITADGKTIASTATNKNTNIVEMATYNLESKSWNFLGNLGYTLDGVASSVWGMTPDANTIVGLANTENKNARGVYWNKEKGCVDIGVTYADRYSRINDVSNDGKIFVGWQDTYDGSRTGCFWENGKQTLITNPEGLLVNEISKISGDGKWLVGSSGFYATKWSKETGIVKIEHPYASSFFYGAATAVNKDGSLIVGYYRGAGPVIYGEGFIWTEKMGLMTLNAYVKDILKYDDLGISFALPLEISEDGKQIVGYGKQGTNNAVSFLISLPDSDLSTTNINSTTLEIYPNPTTETINIQTNGKLTTATLYDMNGKLILNTSEKSINVKHLPKGIYILRTIIDGKESTKKIIKK